MRSVIFFTVIFCLGLWMTQVKGENMNNQDHEKVRIYDVKSKSYQMLDKVVKSDAEWKKILTSEQYAVTREHGTERAFCGLPNKGHKTGIYKCVGCGTDLFLVKEK